jgi:signal peptidase I
LNPSQDFIKRVIGSGDTVVYKDKHLTVNGVAWPQKPDGTYSYLEGLRFETMMQFRRPSSIPDRAPKRTSPRSIPRWPR